MARISAAAAPEAAEEGGGGGGGGGGAGARSPATTASFSARDLDTRVSGSSCPLGLGLGFASTKATPLMIIQLTLPKQRGMLLEMDQTKGAASAGVVRSPKRESRGGPGDPLECHLPATAAAGVTTIKTAF